MTKLQDFEHLRQDKRIQFKTETVGGETFTIICYMIADRQLWELPLARECRGITFNSEGECVSRTFHKFFNVGETEETQIQELPFNMEILEKRDGSMLTPVVAGGQVFWKSKKSFYSDVAQQANTVAGLHLNEFAKDMAVLGLTPVFEFTSPENRVVIDYGSTPAFTLLAIRENNSGTYRSYEEMEMFAKNYGLNLIRRYDNTLNECLNAAKTLKNFEGWCLRDTATGFYAKLKTEEYLIQHRVRTDLRVRDVVDMVLNETLDDVKSAITLAGLSLEPVEFIEKDVVDRLVDLREQVEYTIDRTSKPYDFKQIAGDYKDSPMFGLIMSAVRGKEPDYKKYFVNNYRDGYKLHSVYNERF